MSPSSSAEWMGGWGHSSVQSSSGEWERAVIYGASVFHFIIFCLFSFFFSFFSFFFLLSFSTHIIYLYHRSLFTGSFATCRSSWEKVTISHCTALNCPAVWKMVPVFHSLAIS